VVGAGREETGNGSTCPSDGRASSIGCSGRSEGSGKAGETGDTGETGEGAFSGCVDVPFESAGDTVGRAADETVNSVLSSRGEDGSASSGLAIRRPPKDLDKLKSFSIPHRSGGDDVSAKPMLSQCQSDLTPVGSRHVRSEKRVVSWKLTECARSRTWEGS
jgi:hypothetical protein